MREKMETVRERIEIVRDRYKLIICLDCTFLLKKRNKSFVFDKKIKSKYDRMEWIKNGDGERKNRDCDGEKK